MSSGIISITQLINQNIHAIIFEESFKLICASVANYLVLTPILTHSSTRKNHHRKDIENWSKSTKWLALEIVHSTATTVEFKAFFVGENNTKETHYEKSNFVFENGKWYYVDGSFY